MRDAGEKVKAELAPNPAGIDLGQRLGVLTTAGFADYALLDSGNGRKLERFGRFTVDRPEPQAMWQPALPAGVWLRADAVFKGGKEEDEDGKGGRWTSVDGLPASWPLEVLGVTALCRLTNFRHLGIFPEQLPLWHWMLAELAKVRERPIRVLNLFAYTGVASLLAAKAGAEVTHLDASKRAVAWAKENQLQSGLASAPVRWIVEDARKFAARELRRGKRYQLILLDPPKFGRGPAGEVWDVFTDLAPLLRDCAALIGEGPAALALTTYAIRASALAADGLMRECLKGRGGLIGSGELAVVEQAAGRLLPAANFSRWVSDASAS
jgi:23S rRNA (cytosine1962-C5)-methyltransferase